MEVDVLVDVEANNEVPVDAGVLVVELLVRTRGAPLPYVISLPASDGRGPITMYFRS